MRYQVPQFVDIEDKIIGPFTLKQFIYYLVAGMFLVLIFFVVRSVAILITFAIPILGIAAAFAHFKYHNQSLPVVVGNALGFMLKGSLYVWRRTAKVTPLAIKAPELDAAAGLADLPPTLLARAQELETKGNIVNEDIELDDDMAPEEVLQDTALHAGQPGTTATENETSAPADDGAANTTGQTPQQPASNPPPGQPTLGSPSQAAAQESAPTAPRPANNHQRKLPPAALH